MRSPILAYRDVKALQTTAADGKAGVLQDQLERNACVNVAARQQRGVVAVR